MKRIYKYLTILSFILLFGSGCDEFLDRAPLSELSPNNFFQTKGDMRIWMAGMYSEFQSALNGSQCAHLEWGDLRSDNYGNTGYGDTRVYMNAIDASQAQWNWEFLYRTIDRCNVAIEKFPTIPNILPSEYDDYLGQSYGMRALMYFYAIRIWGDVPLITTTWDGDFITSRSGRTPVAEVKKQILDDLNEALSRLPVGVTGDRKFYFNRGAAFALKTDVHMWFKEYDEAIAASDYFIGNSNYNLVANEEQWKDMFNNPQTSTETIFNMHWADDNANGNNNWAQRVGASNTNNTYKISQTLFEEFIDRLHSGEGKDGRFWNVIDTVKVWRIGNKVPLSKLHYNIDGVQKCTKYSVINPARTAEDSDYWVVLSTSESFVKIPIYRLADVLTLRAEALNKRNRVDEALDIINQIRSRVGYTKDAKAEIDLSAGDVIEQVEWLILHERQLEFIAEGKRWFDLLRTDKVVEVMDPVMRQRQEAAGVTITGFGDPNRANFPIYYREFESNPSLKGQQNPPYTEG